MMDTITYLSDTSTLVLNDTTIIPTDERQSLFSHTYIDKTLPMKLNDSDKANNVGAWTVIILVFVFYMMIFKIYNRKIEKLFINPLLYLFSFFIYIPVFALLLYVLSDYYGILEYLPLKNFANYIIFYLFVIGYIYLKQVLVNFFSFLFFLQETCRNYNQNQQEFYFLDGFIFMILLFLYFYLENYHQHLIIIMSVVFFMLLIIRFIRGCIQIFRVKKISTLYLFLYLCILEFIPVMVVLRYLNQ